MPNYFVTFSPNQAVWTAEQVVWMLYVYKDFLDSTRNSDAYRLVTGYGSKGTHPHFHCHLIGCDVTARTIKRRFDRYMLTLDDDIPHGEDTYYYRYERQLGNNTEAKAYMDENLQEVSTTAMTVIVDEESEDYSKIVLMSKEYDKILTPQRYFKLTLSKIEQAIVSKKDKVGLTHSDITTIFDEVDKEYYLHRINEFELIRLQNSFLKKYTNRSSL